MVGSYLLVCFYAASFVCFQRVAYCGHLVFPSNSNHDTISDVNKRSTEPVLLEKNSAERTKTLLETKNVQPAAKVSTAVQKHSSDDGGDFCIDKFITRWNEAINAQSAILHTDVDIDFDVSSVEDARKASTKIENAKDDLDIHKRRVDAVMKRTNLHLSIQSAALDANCVQEVSIEKACPFLVIQSISSLTFLPRCHLCRRVRSYLWQRTSACWELINRLD